MQSSPCHSRTRLNHILRPKKADVRAHRGQLIEAGEELVQCHDQLLGCALGGQAGEAFDVSKQNAEREEATGARRKGRGRGGGYRHRVERSNKRHQMDEVYRWLPRTSAASLLTVHLLCKPQREEVDICSALVLIIWVTLGHPPPSLPFLYSTPPCFQSACLSLLKLIVIRSQAEQTVSSSQS